MANANKGAEVLDLARAKNKAQAIPSPAVRIDGAELLNAVHAYHGRFVAYPSEHEHVAHTLWTAHTHLMDAWESTPRIAFLSPEPGSGKTRALEITETLVPRPIEAINATPAYLFRKVSDPEGAPTILYDEIDTLFGPKAKDNEEIRGILNAGHRRGATLGQRLARPPFALPCAFHADLGLLAQSRRALVCADQRTQNQARHSSQYP